MKKGLPITICHEINDTLPVGTCPTIIYQSQSIGVLLVLVRGHPFLLVIIIIRQLILYVLRSRKVYTIIFCYILCITKLLKHILITVDVL